MGLLTGDLPRTQIIVARLLKAGDAVTRSDRSFGMVREVMHAPEIETVTIEFIDGNVWIGDDDHPFPVAVSRNEAAEWNRRRSELDVREQMALHDP
jgi:hypothetical protein